MLLERFKFYIKHSVNDLSVNKQRSLFGLFCIAAGVGAIVSLLTLGVMIDNTLTGSLQESNRGDIRYSSFGDRGDDEDEGTRSSGDTALTEDNWISEQGIERIIAWYADYFNVSPQDNCANGAPFCITYRQAISGNSGIFVIAPKEDGEPISRLVDAYILDVTRYPLYGNVESEDGVPLREMIDPASYTDPNRATGDIVISRNLASILKAKVGDTIRINGASKDFTIRGIVPTRTEGGFENLLGSILGYYYLDLNARSLFPEMEPAYNNVYVRLADPSQTETVSDRFERRYSMLNVTTTEDLRELNETISTTVRQFVSMMGLVSMLIGGIGIVNTMLVIVRRRTGEVAVLKTLGLQPTEVSILFLVEAVLMGVIGSLMGVVLGFAMVYLIKSVAEAFLAQSLSFTVAPVPILTGIIVGTLVTTIFGFLPTLAASQVRPASVLRPQETVIATAGLVRSFAALLVVILALSLIAQGMLNELLTGEDLDLIRDYARIAIAVMGILLAGSLIVIGRKYGSMPFQVVRGVFYAIALPLGGYVLGSQLPAVLVILGVFVIVGYLYVALWLLIWAAGGGRIRELWPGILVLLFPLFWPLIPMLFVLVVPVWLLGWLIQKFSFVDFKIAMRSMLAAKGRGASTLVALVVGIFTLSLITMMVDTIRGAFERELIDRAGGNLVAFVGGNSDSAALLEDKLNNDIDGINSFAVIRSYNTEFVSYHDASQDMTYSRRELRERVTNQDSYYELLSDLDSGLDARSVNSNLPDYRFYRGRQLQQSDLGQAVVIVPANDATLAADFDVGDQLTFRFVSFDGGRRQRSAAITFTIVGMSDQRDGGFVTFGSNFYIPLEFLPSDQEFDIQPEELATIMDADESKITAITTELLDIPGVFVLETRLINDLVNRILDQFTRLPTIVAALALFTGGIVIANSVALSMMERRREIAIMKAVGLQRRRVLTMLLLENGLMGTIGGFIGVGISSVLLFIMLTRLFDNVLGKSIPYLTAILLMLLCVGIALIASVISVWGASSEKPLNVLRYE